LGGHTSESEKRQSFGDVMVSSIAYFSNDIVQKGLVQKKDIIQWAVDRFESNGQYNVQTYDTELEVVNSQGDIKSFVLQHGTILRFDQDIVQRMCSVRFLIDEGMRDTGFDDVLDKASEYGHFVIWKMYTEPTDADSTIVFGMFVDFPDVQPGTHSSELRGVPAVVDTELLVRMMVAGVVLPYGDMV